MRIKTSLFATLAALTVATPSISEGPGGQPERLLDPPGRAIARFIGPKERLGMQLFFDTNLSEPAGQSCATCHDPRVAFTDPDRSLPTS